MQVVSLVDRENVRLARTCAPEVVRLQVRIDAQGSRARETTRRI